MKALDTSRIVILTRRQHRQLTGRLETLEDALRYVRRQRDSAHQILPVLASRRLRLTKLQMSELGPGDNCPLCQSTMPCPRLRPDGHHEACILCGRPTGDEPSNTLMPHDYYGCSHHGDLPMQIRLAAVQLKAGILR